MTESPAVPQRPPMLARALGVGFAVIAGAPWAVMLGIFLFVVPKFREIFDRFELNLPAATQAIISISAILTTLWPVAVMVVAECTVLLAVFCGRARTSRGMIVAVVACAVSLLLFAGCLTILVLSLFLPLVVDIKMHSGRQ